MQVDFARMKKTIFVILIISVLAASCPEAWAFFFFGISEQEEIEIGRKIAQSIEKQMPIYRGLKHEKRLMKIGYRLVSVCDRRNLEYNFTIIDKEEINAFATFGGYIYINKGAMDKAETDDELAAILAHEIGHVCARHLIKRMEQNQLFSLGFFTLNAFVLRKQKHGRDIARAVNLGLNIIQNGYSQQDEFEADRLGVRYCYYAGYNPLAAISIMKKLKEEKRTKGPDSIFENIGILRTHPYLDDRMKAVFSEYSYIKASESYKSRRPESPKP